MLSSSANLEGTKEINMGLTNFPNGVSSFGVPVVGSGGTLPFTSGTYFFVGSAHSGVDSPDYGTMTSPFATIDYAIGKCTDSKGDVIVVLPGHTETVSAAAGIDVDVAGITIVGVGNGTLMPTVTLGTDTDADIDIDAANVTISGIKFTSAIDSLKVVLDVNYGNFTITDCIFDFASTYECLNPINIATTKDDFKIIRCWFRQAADPGGTDAAAGTGVVYCVDSENILIKDCQFYGYWETAIVHNKTTACKNLVIDNCVVNLDGPSTAVPLELVAGATGGIYNCCGYNTSSTDVSEAALFGAIGTFFWINNTELGNDSGGGGQNGVGGTACS